MKESEIVIPKPSFSQGVGKHLIKWDELGITAEISRIKDDSHCELMVIHENGGGKELLLQPTSVNLISSRDLSGLARRLSEKTPQLDDKNWNTMLGSAAYLSITALREGDPVILLNDEKYGKTRPEFLLPPLFIQGAPNIIYAERGAAKTTFIILIDLLLTLPWVNNPLGLFVRNDSKHKVLFLDWENNDQIIGWQKSCLRRGMGVDDFPIPYRHCARSLSDDLPQIQSKIEETGADVVIIDSLGMAVGDDLNLTKPAFTFFGALRQLPVTPIILAHTAKDKEKKFKTVYGNYFYECESRSIWEAEKQQEPDSNELTFILYHRKSAPFMGLHSPLAYKFTFKDDQTLIEKTESGSYKRGSDNPVSEIDVVYSIIEESKKPMQPKEIGLLTDPKLPGNNVRQAIYQLKKANKIKLVDGGYIIT